MVKRRDRIKSRRSLSAEKAFDIARTRHGTRLIGGNLINAFEISFTDLPELERLPPFGTQEIHKLDLSNTKVADLTPIKRMWALRRLILSGTPVSDLSPLSECTELQYLYLDATRVSDLRPLMDLRSLRELYLGNSLVSDISPLASLKGLEVLNIAGTQVSTLTAVSKLSKLHTLHFSNTNISDLSPLARLETLVYGAKVSPRQGLAFEDCPLSDPILRTLERTKNPSRTILTISYLRRLQNLPSLDKAIGPSIDTLLSEHSVAKWTNSGESEEPPPIGAIPNQIQAATNFMRVDFGPIALAPDEPTHSPLVDDDQRDLHAEMLEKTKVLIARIPAETNAWRELIGDLNLFKDALSSRLEEVRITRFWSRANTLREIIAADLRAQKNLDPDPPPLPEDIYGRLSDLVHTINIFNHNDPKARELDARRLGPRGREDTDAANLAAMAIATAAARAPEVATSEAVASLTEQLKAAVNADHDIHGDLAAGLAQASSGNFINEILRAAYRPLRAALASAGHEGQFAWKGVREGFYRGAGAAGLATSAVLANNYWGHFVDFVARNSAAFSDFLLRTYNNPTLQSIIEIIRNAV